MQQPELGKKVVALRLARGLTQQELADVCQVSLRTIQRIELAEVNPRSFTVKTIFSALDYDIYATTTHVSKNSFSWALWLKEVCNLKKNTMKKISFLTLILFIIVFLGNRQDLQAQKINGWFKTGSKASSYEIGLDKTMSKTGKKCAFIKSVDDDIKGFGTLMQTCEAKFYLGKRIKMIGYIKTVEVKNWCGMWLRVDGVNDEGKRKTLSFDNMYQRSLKGTTEWTRCEIILNVPKESKTLNFGVLVNGTGTAYFDRLNFEILGNIDEKEGKTIPDRPANIDFEE